MLKTKITSIALCSVLVLGLTPAMALANTVDDGSSAAATRELAIEVSNPQIVKSGFYVNGSDFDAAFGTTDAIANTFFIQLSDPVPTGETLLMNVTVGNTVYSVGCVGNDVDNLFYFSFDNINQVDFYNDGSGWKSTASDGVPAAPAITAGTSAVLEVYSYAGTMPSSYPSSGLTLMTEPVTISVPSSGSVVENTYTASLNSVANGTANMTAASGYSGSTLNLPAGSTITIVSTPSEGYTTTSVVATNSYGYSLEVPYQDGVGYVLTMPDTDISITVYNTETVTPAPEGVVFVDVPNNAWYHDSVYEAYDLGYIHGYRPGYFGPQDNVLRSQIATILFNMSGYNSETFQGTAYFPDVNTGDYFYDSVAWAQSNGIIQGYSLPDGSVFGPYDNATREQLMTMIYRYAQLAEGTNFKPLQSAAVDQVLRAFPDGNQVSGYARDAVAWCVVNGVVLGVDNNGTRYLAPHNPITRAETATIAVRYQPERVTTPVGK